MLVPIYLSICGIAKDHAGHAAASQLMTGNASVAIAVALVHTAAMMLSGGLIAIGVYRWFGMRFLSRSWFNLDLLWATSLVLVGAISLLMML